jgi:hypothetical protein
VRLFLEVRMMSGIAAVDRLDELAKTPSATYLQLLPLTVF